MDMLSGEDNAVGDVRLSQTKIVALYVPDCCGIQDIPGLKDWFGLNEPVKNDNDIVTPFSSWICTR